MKICWDFALCQKPHVQFRPSQDMGSPFSRLRIQSNAVPGLQPSLGAWTSCSGRSSISHVSHRPVCALQFLLSGIRCSTVPHEALFEPEAQASLRDVGLSTCKGPPSPKHLQRPEARPLSEGRCENSQRPEGASAATAKSQDAIQGYSIV